jgi:hypothetical protein
MIADELHLMKDLYIYYFLRFILYAQSGAMKKKEEEEEDD